MLFAIEIRSSDSGWGRACRSPVRVFVSPGATSVGPVEPTAPVRHFFGVLLFCGTDWGTLFCVAAAHNKSAGRQASPQLGLPIPAALLG